MSFKSPLEIIFGMKSKNVVVQLKNGFSIRGLLEDVDYFLNVKLSNITATDKNLVSFKRANAIFIRGNLISSIILEKNTLDKIINKPKEKTSKDILAKFDFKEYNVPKNDFVGKKRYDLKKKFKY